MVVNQSGPAGELIFSYEIPEELRDSTKVGSIVLVPFANHRRSGVVLNLSEHCEFENPKKIISVLSGDFIIDPKIIRLCKWVARKYFSPLLRSIRLAIPAAQDVSIEQIIRYIGVPINSYPADSILEKITLYLSIKGEVRYKSLVKKFGAQSVKLLQRLVVDNVAEIIDVPRIKYSPKFEKYLELNRQGDFNIRYGTVGQKIINLLIDKESMKLSDVRAITKASQTTIKSLIKSGVIRMTLRKAEIDHTSLGKDEYLNLWSDDKAQSILSVLKEDDLENLLEQAVNSNKRNRCIIAGLDIKTLLDLTVYIAQMAVCRRMSVLFIFPEVLKITESANMMREKLDIKPIEIHADISPHLRTEAYLRIQNDKSTRIVLGTRSAVFTSFPDLNLIVLAGDGEYGMQESASPAYNAREVALKRSEIEKVPCIILSSYPSMESYRMAVEDNKMLFISNVLQKRMNELGIRFFGSRGLSGDNMKGHIIGEDLLERIRHLISNGESVLFFVNRKGYANFVRCSSCHKAVVCDNCGYAMSLYKRERLLICHSCRASRSYVYECPYCGKGHLSPVGFGTQRIEIELKKKFFDRRVIRLDSDLSGIDEREAELLVASDLPALIIGTQKVGTTRFVKFPRLAVIFGYDFMINLPDFRCRENAIRTLVRLSDAIEPNDNRESILIETSMEELPFYKNLQKFDLKKILDLELEGRKIHFFPPYTEKMNITIASPKIDELSDAEINLEAMLNRISSRYDDVSFQKLHSVSKKIKGSHIISFILSMPDIYKRSYDINRLKNSFKKIVSRDVKLSLNNDPSVFM